MIKKTGKGYQVVSESKDKSGKHKALSKSNLSKAEARKRLMQVEYFKRHPK